MTTPDTKGETPLVHFLGNIQKLLIVLSVLCVVYVVAFAIALIFYLPTPWNGWTSK